MAFVVLVVLCVIPAVARGLRGGAVRDPAQRLLSIAVRALPRNRLGWGDAMLEELGHVQEWRSRWRFALGCAWASGRIRLQSPEPGGAGLRAVIFGGAALSLGLVGYGVIQYPGLRSEPSFRGAMVVFVMTLVAYVAIAVLLARGATHQSAVARRFGIGGGLVTGVGWLLGISPPTVLKAWVLVPLLIAIVGPALVAILAGHRVRDSRTGNRTALWSALVAGLTVFIVWTTVTYTTAGGPYDAGLVNDFQKSGAHDLPTYAISDSLGSGLVLLLMVPMVALALGTLGARFVKK